jgi:hypothetical protein
MTTHHVLDQTITMPVAVPSPKAAPASCSRRAAPASACNWAIIRSRPNSHPLDYRPSRCPRFGSRGCKARSRNHSPSTTPPSASKARCNPRETTPSNQRHPRRRLDRQSAHDAVRPSGVLRCGELPDRVGLRRQRSRLSDRLTDATGYPFFGRPPAAIDHLQATRWAAITRPFCDGAAPSGIASRSVIRWNCPRPVTLASGGNHSRAVIFRGCAA